MSVANRGFPQIQNLPKNAPFIFKGLQARTLPKMLGWYYPTDPPYFVSYCVDAQFGQQQRKTTA
jgi:hypothetical protein